MFQTVIQSRSAKRRLMRSKPVWKDSDDENDGGSSGCMGTVGALAVPASGVEEGQTKHQQLQHHDC